MTEQLEQGLRHIFAEDAERAPVSAALEQGHVAVCVSAGMPNWPGPPGDSPWLFVSVVCSAGNRSATPPAASKGPLAIHSGIAPKGR